MPAWLTKPIATLACQGDPQTVMVRLVAALQERGLPIDKQDREGGEVIARCFMLCANWGLWRCWSDKLRFNVTGGGAKSTTLEISALPNLFRWRLRDGEAACDAKSLIGALQGF